MKFNPKRYTVLMHQINNPYKGGDIGNLVVRAEQYEQRNKELEKILTEYDLNAESSEEDVKKSLRGFLSYNAYRNNAIIRLVYDLKP